MSGAVTPQDERLLGRFLDWLRSQGLAVCSPVRDPEQRWRPVAESAGTLLERFGASCAAAERTENAPVIAIEPHERDEVAP